MVRKPRERLRRRECRRCGIAFDVAPIGRQRVYCSDSCRRRAWDLNQAAEQLGTFDGAGPQVVHDVIERIVEKERVVPGPPQSPCQPRDWMSLLAELTKQLHDDGSPVVRQHYEHQRLDKALTEALTALDRAHPGGLRRRR